MDTCPDFALFLSGIDNKKEKHDALKILKHVWGQLDKKEQKNLFSLLHIMHLSHKHEKEAKEEIDECKKELIEHPEILELFNKFYTRVVTPVSSKDHFKSDRIRAAAGLEKGIKELQNKNLVKSFEIKRVA